MYKLLLPMSVTACAFFVSAAFGGAIAASPLPLNVAASLILVADDVDEETEAVRENLRPQIYAPDPQENPQTKSTGQEQDEGKKSEDVEEQELKRDLETGE
jgi:hypothetical protein